MALQVWPLTPQDPYPTLLSHLLRPSLPLTPTNQRTGRYTHTYSTYSLSFRSCWFWASAPVYPLSTPFDFCKSGPFSTGSSGDAADGCWCPSLCIHRALLWWDGFPGVSWFCSSWSCALLFWFPLLISLREQSDVTGLVSLVFLQ